MESAFRDYAFVRGVFDDRGVADTMDSLMDADNARLMDADNARENGTSCLWIF